MSVIASVHDSGVSARRMLTVMVNYFQLNETYDTCSFLEILGENTNFDFKMKLVFIHSRNVKISHNAGFSVSSHLYTTL